MAELLVDALTKKFLDSAVNLPKHAVLLHGDAGVGAGAIAKDVAYRIVTSPEHVLIIEPEKSTITVETIRGLYALTRSARKDAFVVLIDDADMMGVEAQNTLLKLLEEPPSHVHFILTSHAPHQLLPTITSRTEQILIRPLARHDSEALITREGVTDTATRAKLLFLANGKPAELCRLIHDAEYFAQWTGRMSDAKSFLESDTYDRLILLKKYMADRQEAEAFIRMVGQLLSYSLQRAQTESLVNALVGVEQALDTLNKNGNVRAQLLRLNQHIS